MIQLDSIQRLWPIQHILPKYIVFLDEFHSILTHLFSTPHLDKNRIPVYLTLQKIINEAAAVICVDADIGDMCLMYLQQITKRQFYFIENTFQPISGNEGRGVEATEIEDENRFVDLLSAEETFLCTTDSATKAEVLLEKLVQRGVTDVKLITAKQDEYKDLDDYKRVIFSPKIIYGVDSQLQRPVYAMFYEHTTSPFQMRQMIGRCRYPTYIRYIFFKKKYKPLENIRIHTENHRRT